MSEFVTACPNCGKPLNPIGPARAGSSDPNPKPNAVRCIDTEQHTFPVLEQDQIADGRPRYRLGEQLEDR